MNATARLVLKPGREKSLRHRHPWIFSGAVDRVDGTPASGDTVQVCSHDGAPLAMAAFSPASQIRARVWTFDAATRVNEDFLSARLEQAVSRRAGMLDSRHTACRLVHSESDQLPGLVVDRYGDVAVVQLLSAGAERWRDFWPEALARIAGVRAVYERSDAEVRGLEGLAPRTGPLRGEAGPTVEMVEGGMRYAVDIVNGQKTG